MHWRQSGSTGGNLGCISQHRGHLESPYSYWHLPLTLTTDSNWESLMRYCPPPPSQHFHSPPNPVPPLQTPQCWVVGEGCWGH